ncbi:MAG: helix-turn-helix domain-containing protein [Clostridia bacterium]|nr:helix-turn-helix domain-containing protein [Clostridia bacterium]
MIDLLRLPNGTVLTPKDMSLEERIAYLEALIHLSAPTLARMLAGETVKSGEPLKQDGGMAAVRGQYSDLPAVLTIAEAAEVLKVGKSTVYEMTRRWGGKFFPHFRLGNTIRIPRDKLIEWINDVAW